MLSVRINFTMLASEVWMTSHAVEEMMAVSRSLATAAS